MSQPALEPALFALLGALFFGAGLIFAKVGLRRWDPLSGAMVSVPTTLVLFLLLAPWRVEAAQFFSPAVPVFALVGVVFPAVVTLLTFEANHRLGPTVTATVSSLAPLVAVLGGVTLLGEPATLSLLGGTLAIVFGVTQLSRGGAPGARFPSRAALLLPRAGAALRGGSQLLLKVGLEALPNPFMAGLVGYSVSGLTLLAAFRFFPRAGRRFRPGRWCGWFVGTGFANGAAMLCLYTALARGNVALVAPIVATFPLFTMVFSRFFLREEALHRHTLAGALLVAGGLALVLW